MLGKKKVKIHLVTSVVLIDIHIFVSIIYDFNNNEIKLLGTLYLFCITNQYFVYMGYNNIRPT